MKKITNLLALILALALVLSLAACAGKASIVGTWKYTMDANQIMEASGAMDELTSSEDSGMTEEQAKAVLDTFKKIFDGVSMVMVLDLKEDNSYTMSMDEASAKAASETLSKRLPEMMPELLTAMFGGEEGLNSFLEMAGMTMEQMSANFAEEFKADELVKSMTSEASKGTYTYEEGKLVLTAEGEGEEPLTMTVELTAKELKVTAVDTKDEDDAKQYKAMLPMVFTK